MAALIFVLNVIRNDGEIKSTEVKSDLQRQFLSCSCKCGAEYLKMVSRLLNSILQAIVMDASVTVMATGKHGSNYRLP